MKNFVFRIFLFFLTYFEGILKAYIFFIIFGLVTAVLLDVGWERPLTVLLSITPGVGLGSGGNFEVDNTKITTFFLFWGAVVSLIFWFLKKYLGIKIDFKGRGMLLFGIILHTLSFVIFSFRFGVYFSLFFVGICAITYFLSLFFCRKICLFKRFIK